MRHKYETTHLVYRMGCGDTSINKYAILTGVKSRNGTAHSCDAEAFAHLAGDFIFLQRYWGFHINAVPLQEEAFLQDA